MIQYMLDTGLMPGTGQDVSMIAAKLGIQGPSRTFRTIIPTTWFR